MLKKIVLNIINGVSVIIIAAAVLVLLTVVLTKSGDVPNILGYSVFRVMTGSMEPAIETDSLIVVKRVEASEIKIGDVISFFSQDPAHGGAVNTHRVTAIEQNGEEWNFVTKGDANQLEDKYVTSSKDLIGKVVYVSHVMGIIVHLLSNPLIFIPVIVLPMFVILVYNLACTIRVTRNIVKEEEEAAVREAVEAIRKSRGSRSQGDRSLDSSQGDRSLDSGE